MGEPRRWLSSVLVPALVGSVLVGSMLVGCAPAAIGPSVGEGRTDLSAQDTASICAASPRVMDRGVLLYGPAGAESSLPPAYDLVCPDVRIRAQDLQVTVTAPTLDRALGVFTPDALLLAYYADLMVRVQGEQITADDDTTLPDLLRDEYAGITVTVQPDGGNPLSLLRAGRVTPVTVPAGVPYTIRINAGRTPVAWPVVRIDPAGTVTATMAR